MAKNFKHYCRKCRHAMDDQDLSVVYTNLDGDGNREFDVLCNWCGHRWRTYRPAEHLPGYKKAEAARQERAQNHPRVVRGTWWRD